MEEERAEYVVKHNATFDTVIDNERDDYETTSEQPTDNTKNNNNDDNAKSSLLPKKRRCCIYSVAGLVTVSLMVVAAVLIWYYTTRQPKNIPVVAAPALTMSPPSLVQYGAIQGFPGSVRIDATRSLSAATAVAANNRRVLYWLTVSNDTNYPNADETTNITLALTKSRNVTVLSSSNLLLSIPNIETQSFPLLLPETFDPKLSKGFVFLLGEGDVLNATNITIVGSAVWSYDASPLNGSDRTATTPNSSVVSSLNATAIQPAVPSAVLNHHSPVSSPLTTMTALPTTPSTTTAPTSTTSTPLLQLQATLCCSFTGRISLQYRVDIVNSVPTQVPYFLFENITVAGEPAPYLYLSHNPNGLPISAQDVELLIQGTDSTGSFTKTGTFTQDFPSTLTLDALPTFAGGSFTVWCTQYSVWLSGGPLVFAY